MVKPRTPEAALRHALEGIKEADFEIGRQREKRAFHRGQKSILEEFDVRPKTSVGAPTISPLRKRKWAAKVRKPNESGPKYRVMAYLADRPNSQVSYDQICSDLPDLNAGSIRDRVCKMRAAGLVDYDGGVVVWRGVVGDAEIQDEGH